MDSGELNPQSSWAKYTCGERAYYYRDDRKAYSLSPPPEGVRGEEEESAEEFEEEFAKACSG